MDQESYIMRGGKLILKISMGLIIPGSGAAVDFIEGGYALYKGDYSNCGLSFATGAIDILTFGATSFAKNAVKEGSKEPHK